MLATERGDFVIIHSVEGGAMDWYASAGFNEHYDS